jgi:predicted DNA-binding WGR domain protein
MLKFKNESNGRFYYLKVCTDMLNNEVLHINYGGYNTSRYRTLSFDDRISMREEIERITKKRLKHGYQLVT